MNFVKALVPGALLSWIVASLIGRHGNHGGMLNIETVVVQGHQLQWSWSLFVVGTALAWFVFSTMD